MKTEVSFRPILLGAALSALASPFGQAQSSATVQYYAGLTYTGLVGSGRSVQAVNTLVNGSQSWTTLTNFNLPANPFLYIDVTSAGASSRFYRPEPAGVSLRSYPGLTISGALGSTNLAQYDNSGTWTTLATVVLTTSPFLWIDTSAPISERRTYRVVDVGLPPIITSPGTQRAQTGYPMSFQITTLSVPAVSSYGAVGLPSGLSIIPSSGLIFGTPDSVGTNTVTVTATSPNGTGMGTLVLRIRTVARPEMVPIPTGTFTMGSAGAEAGRGPDEGPTTQVTLTQGFAISTFEITQAEYRDVVGTSPSYFTGNFSRPVEQVTYDEATNYCALLTARDRSLGAIALNQAYRLPTEAEWEWAARAGTSTRFSFGNADVNLSAFGWHSANSGATTHSVGDRSPNPWGLYDIHGNCWEWCSDYYGAYPGGSATNPQGPGVGSTRVLRGGSWFQPAEGCRSANRDSLSPTGRFADVGFRVVLATGP